MHPALRRQWRSWRHLHEPEAVISSQRHPNLLLDSPLLFIYWLSSVDEVHPDLHIKPAELSPAKNDLIAHLAAALDHQWMPERYTGAGSRWTRDRRCDGRNSVSDGNHFRQSHQHQGLETLCNTIGMFLECDAWIALEWSLLLRRAMRCESHVYTNPAKEFHYSTEGAKASCHSSKFQTRHKQVHRRSRGPDSVARNSS